MRAKRASLAEFDRDLIIERTRAGLSAARARGRKGGRPKGLSADAQKKAVAAEALYKEGHLNVNAIAENLGVSKSTLYKYLRHRGVSVVTLGIYFRGTAKLIPAAVSFILLWPVRQSGQHTDGGCSL